MPSGRAHDGVTWFLVTPMGFAAWAVGHDAAGTLAATAAFTFAGLMFSGDLDLKSQQYRRWGLLRWIWKPYQWVVPHRSFLSHGLLVGPLLRLAYLSAAALALMAGGIRLATGYWSFPWVGIDAAATVAAGLDDRGWVLLAYALAGLWIGGASHSLADWGWSGLKRRR